MKQRSLRATKILFAEMAANETTFSGDDLVSVDMNDEEEETSSAAKYRRESDSRLKRRHYKKDSRFLLDLYTLTFDEDQVRYTI